jgi:hypothetical protein
VITPCGGGSSSSGIQFDTYPQSGQWLYIQADGPATSPSGFGLEMYDASGWGISLGSGSGGPLLLQASGGGDIIIQQSNAGAKIILYGHIDLQASVIDAGSLPTIDPGITGRLWNNGGVVSVSP